MGHKYRVRDTEGVYFITNTVIDWVDVFIRKSYRDCLLESFRYCITHKGLNLHAYVIMSSHYHAIVSANEGYNLSAIIRDMKRFTSTKIIKMIQEEPESRRTWLLKKFDYAAQKPANGKKWKLWKDGYHAKQIETNHFLEQKLDYIHQNPVLEAWVAKPEDYLYSSASNYAGQESLIEVTFLD